jgi:hypothetical protein
VVSAAPAAKLQGDGDFAALLKGRAGQLQCHAVLQQKNTPSPTTTPVLGGDSFNTTI